MILLNLMGGVATWSNVQGAGKCLLDLPPSGCPVTPPHLYCYCPHGRFLFWLLPIVVARSVAAICFDALV